ncbi:MAG: protein TolQ [Pseudomonadales bacterium]|nr:protein TolQ [Pseudomonadales bacterium]MDP6470990.1 protein TolQ [Pseudomonadales bacterium]MDP6825825.1 protein TolQ [Pseudomonadales bacterium]MDP6970182.1 protein TolQ [Pseudomonadales bacterium]
MPEQISIFELISNASLLVQVVMAMLALASVVSWMMIFQRWFFLRRVQREVDEFEHHFWSGIDLRELYAELEGEEALNGIETIFVGGFTEFNRLSEQFGAELDSIMQGAQRAMRVALTREEQRLEQHLAFLATVGSTSPYVGLFGTVWGIMNSFRSLANMSQATLASVAPGISEALVATAMGLFAAIPAVIGYNRFSARVEALMKRYEAFSDEVTSILHRAAQARLGRQ